MFKKIWFVIFVLIFNINVLAQDMGTEEATDEMPQYRAFVLGDTKGNILYAENENEKFPLASVTKIMTLMLTYDALNEGRIKLTDKVVVDKTMAQMEGSRIWMKEGSKITVEDLIKATALHSANNAAYGLAKYVGGDVDTFVKMMNVKARELGFGNEIEYNTPTGLPPHMTGRGEDVGSAEGVYKLSLAALEYPEYIKVASQKEMRVAYLNNTKVYNRNKLLGKEGIYGIKTGHHDNWYNIAVASDKEGMDSVAVVIGAPTEELRNEKIINGIELFHIEYKIVDFLDENIPVDRVDVAEGTVKSVEVYPDKNFENLAKYDDEVKFIVYRKEFIKAPFKAEDKVGKYELYIGEKLIDSGDLIVKDSVEKRENFFEF